MKYIGFAVFVGHNVTFSTWLVGGTDHEKGVFATPIVGKIFEQEGVLVHCIHRSADLKPIEL